jgi:hypothetical protein
MTMGEQSRKLQFAIVLSLCVAGGRTAWGAVEQEGQIRGRIVEASTGAPVPGATVTVSSPSLGQPHSVTTNEDGDYLVSNLPMGLYTVKVSYSGVKPMTREILVQPGRTAPLDIQWSAELTEVETTSVIVERPLTNPDSTQTGAVLSNEQEKNLPTSRRYTDVVRQVPGVTTNPSGVDQFIKGGRSAHNRYLVDGLDITDPVRRTAQQELAFDSIDAVQVITGGFDAEYNVFGGIINTITREGSDEWHGGASVFVTNEALNNRKAQGLQTYERDRAFSDDPLSPSYGYNTTVSVGGPILKQRLWFNTTMEFRNQHNGRLVGPPLNVPHVPETITTYLPRLKVTWAPSLRQRLSLSLAADPSFQNNTNGSNARLSTYETHTDQGGYNAILSWSVFPNPNFEFRIDAGIKTQYVNSGPQGYFGDVDTRGCDQFSPINCTYDRDRPSHVNQTDGTTWYNANTAYSRDTRSNIQIDPKINFRGRWLGEHSAKIGIQFKLLQRRNSLHQSGGYSYTDSGGPPLEDGLCDPDSGRTAGCNMRDSVADRKFKEWGYSPALFLQDKWRVVRWLTINPGIRFDYGRSYTNDGQLFHSMFAVGPRLGAIADLTGDQKTIWSIAYGRSNEVAEIGNAADYDSNVQGARTFERWDRSAGRFVFDHSTGGEGGGVIDRNAKVPHVDEITTSLRREIFRNSAAAVEYTWKRIANTWDKPEINRVWDISGYRVINYVDGQAHTIDLYTTPDANVRNYQGITFSVEGRPTPNWYFLAFYTLSWLYGTSEAQNTTAFVIPQQRRFYNGFLPEDHRHQMHLVGSYNFHGLVVGARLEYVSGNPRSKLFRNFDTNSNQNFRSPRGTDPGTCSGGIYIPATVECGNDIGRISEYRIPPRAQLDLHLEYDFYQLLRQHIALIGDIFNLFNDRSAITLEQNDNTAGTFGTVTGRYAALNIRLGARYEF